ncbi:hypothetical protein DASC09_010310 [Saccharomycopsis crataegensis]|uniref:Uncharacterized protein n=1 Tax=Saccharomycopsis crataegensis TaxID=43959 RepID=A0AAV5QGI1_9ASCO|nr:hypothetical protein DASC09_010310 [Saccharomycopsis crataegensis]
MAFGDSSDLINDTRYQSSIHANIDDHRSDKVLLNNNDTKNITTTTATTSTMKTNIVNTKSGAAKFSEGHSSSCPVSVPDLTDTEGSNDESFDEEDDVSEIDGKENHANANEIGITPINQYASIKKSGPDSDTSMTSGSAVETVTTRGSMSDAFGQLFINDSHHERQVIMKIIVRIVANSLITKFPIDDCCNNRNNLIINNLIDFLEKVLTRSRMPLNQFLAGILYLNRLANNIHSGNNKHRVFKNNSDKLCLRRLIITSFLATSTIYAKPSSLPRGVRSESKNPKFTKQSMSPFEIKQRILNQNLNAQVWSVISGLPVTFLDQLYDNFLDWMTDDDLKVNADDLRKYKGSLNQMVKWFIKTDPPFHSA